MQPHAESHGGIGGIGLGRAETLSRIAQLDQRAPDQCLHSAEADMRPPRRESGFEPQADINGKISLRCTGALVW